MAVFVQDSFTDTDGTALEAHVGEVGAVWTPRTGIHPASSAVITAERVRFSTIGNQGASYAASGVPGTAEYDVECDLYNSPVCLDATGIFARWNGPAATYYLARTHFQQTVQLYRFVNGAAALIGSAPFTRVSGETVHLKLEVRDASKRVLIDGVEYISSPDNVITGAGLVGIQTYTEDKSPGPDRGVHLDNFLATDLSGGTPEPVTITADYTPIPVTSYSVGITQGQQVTADYTQVPIETYGAGVEISPVQIGAGFTQIDVTSYDAQAIPGSTGIGATYTEVPVYSYDPGIIQGRIVSAAYDEISVTSYDAAVIPGAIGIGADYTLIPVESYSAGITQGVGIGASFDEVPVTSFAASIIQGLRIGATYTEVPVTSYSAEIVDGSIVRPNRMDCSVRPYYQITASVTPYYDITATVNPAIQ